LDKGCSSKNNKIKGNSQKYINEIRVLKISLSNNKVGS